MGERRCLYFAAALSFLLVQAAYSAGLQEQVGIQNVTFSLRRTMFPKGFLFGTASSAYQYEGAANEGGRGPGVWDTFTHEHPDKIRDRSNGDVAIDSYHRYKEDVGIMKDIGFNAYRFSISWSRVLSSGMLKGGVNREGVEYYNNLIDELLSNGLQPFVTLFHGDYPQALEDAYGSFLSPKIVEDFKDYAELCFREFGDRVKHWITLNEPLSFTLSGYASGQSPPGRCSKKYINCTAFGDSGREPYIAAHHQLLAHAAAVKVYKEKYQVFQKGQIGITLNTAWMMPLSQSKADKDATSSILAFNYGWFMEPLYSGSYPVEMVERVAERLPRFSKEESAVVKGSFDFIGLNYYTSAYAAHIPCPSGPKLYYTDYCANLTSERHGVRIGAQAASTWLYVYPPGIKDLLLYTKQKYGNPVIYITENGIDEINNEKVSLEDNMRIYYISRHLFHLHRAIKSGVQVRGYFTWSLLDNFEWSDGYTVRFGLVFVDYKDNLKRYPKKSALWFKKFLHRHP